eukprot:TRINITY_DN27538_c0_g2_i1.p1 TRINITY_DN27538_c0_g2~~TRINITY_DN27538_c0_g2_i1.p1  ORF type:complete len:198 (+),score=34.45 TRINITY_DN27538_c0_g2_i1:178-771(+)
MKSQEPVDKKDDTQSAFRTSVKFSDFDTPQFQSRSMMSIDDGDQGDDEDVRDTDEARDVVGNLEKKRAEAIPDFFSTPSTTTSELTSGDTVRQSHQTDPRPKLPDFFRESSSASILGGGGDGDTLKLQKTSGSTHPGIPDFFRDPSSLGDLSVYRTPTIDSIQSPSILKPQKSSSTLKIGRAVQQECRDRSRMPSSA